MGGKDLHVRVRSRDARQTIREEHPSCGKTSSEPKRCPAKWQIVAACPQSTAPSGWQGSHCGNEQSPGNPDIRPAVLPAARIACLTRPIVHRLSVQSCEFGGTISP